MNTLHVLLAIVLLCLVSLGAADDPAKKKAPIKEDEAPIEHAKYIDMISRAIEALNERKGSSRQAILKYVKSNYEVGDGAAKQVKQALERGVSQGEITQVKGTGASGSFKLAGANKSAKKQNKAAKKSRKNRVPTKAPKKSAKQSGKNSAAKKPTAKKATSKNPSKGGKGKKSANKK